MSGKSCFAVVLICCCLLFLSSAALAETRPVQISLVTPLQIFHEDDPISGLRINLIYGRSFSVTGLDIGIANHTTGGVSKGVQLGIVGMVDTDFVGLQHNWVNIVKGDMEGFQWGIINHAHYANGFQFGFVNYAESMKGLQIGLINIIKQGGQFPIFPIVNWSF